MFNKVFQKIPNEVRRRCGGIRKADFSSLKESRESGKSCHFRTFGQPTHETHPHLLNKNDVTPSISKSEYQQRREKLMNSVLAYMHDRSVDLPHHLILGNSGAQGDHNVELYTTLYCCGNRNSLDVAVDCRCAFLAYGMLMSPKRKKQYCPCL